LGVGGVRKLLSDDQGAHVSGVMFLLLAVCALDPQRCPLVSAQQGPFAGCVEVRAAGTSTVRLARQESERLQQNWARLVHTSVVKEGGRCEVRRRVKALRKGSAHHDNRVINGENDDFLCSFLSLESEMGYASRRQ